MERAFAAAMAVKAVRWPESAIRTSKPLKMGMVSGERAVLKDFRGVQIRFFGNPVLSVVLKLI